MGLYNKIENAFGKKAAKSAASLFVFLKNIPLNIKRVYSISLNMIKKSKRKETQIFLISTPHHGNMGDQLIAVAENHWLKHYFSDFAINECSQGALEKDKKLNSLLSQINANDLIFFHGGGNVNNWYRLNEIFRRRILIKCPKNKIVLFQQSINLDTVVDGFSIKDKTEKIYNSHKNFTIIAREETSYQNALKSFKTTKNLKYPDMATYLFGKIGPSHLKTRNDVIFCIRKDREKFYTDEQIQTMANKISSDFNITLSDTHVGHAVGSQNRLYEVQKLVDLIAEHKVMVTDRFHGVVFSILANTPCVVLRSADHKITDGVKWFKDVDGIFFAENIEDVPDLVKKAERYAPIKQPDFSHYFEKMYKDLN